jgi:alkylated DNA repair dioxygenase AlkB
MNQNELFPHVKSNLLPFDGEVLYYGKILSGKETEFYFNQLIQTIEWKNDEVIMFGKRMVTPREVSWYGDKDYQYIYSKTAKSALPWTEELLKLKELAEGVTQSSYNSCLLNLYHNGMEGMGWHSDDEDTLVRYSSIASISLGAERKFSLKHKQTRSTMSVRLENGSLLEMKGSTQLNWLHSLPKSKLVTSPRINLTFRRFRG